MQEIARGRGARARARHHRRAVLHLRRTSRTVGRASAGNDPRRDQAGAGVAAAPAIRSSRRVSEGVSMSASIADRPGALLSAAPMTTILPVRDLPRARQFYEQSLGLHALGAQPDGKFVFQCGNGALPALSPKAEGTFAGQRKSRSRINVPLPGKTRPSPSATRAPRRHRGAGSVRRCCRARPSPTSRRSALIIAKPCSSVRSSPMNTGQRPLNGRSVMKSRIAVPLSRSSGRSSSSCLPGCNRYDVRAAGRDGFAQRLVDVRRELRRLAVVQRECRALVLEQQAFVRSRELGEQLAQAFRASPWPVRAGAASRARRVARSRAVRRRPCAGRETGDRRR